jgi:peptidoglycan hydrolase CwlO-like protein
MWPNLLSIQLETATSQNQTLGNELYLLDQAITELEERINNSRNFFSDINKETALLTKKAKRYKTALLNDDQFSALAKKLRSLQKNSNICHRKHRKT